MRERRWALIAAFHGGAELVRRPRREAEGRVGEYLRGAGRLEAYVEEQLRGRAWEIRQLTVTIEDALSAGMVEEEEAWEIILRGARVNQARSRSWEEHGEVWIADIEGVSDGRASGVGEARDMVAAAEAAGLPWELDLGGRRFLRATCPVCGAPTCRPAPTAFVDCDVCAALVGYDFERARAAGLPQPGPAYEALRAELAPLLASSAIHDYRRAQVQLYDAFVEACPAACPIRVRDPDYRARHVAYLAEGATRSAFDRRARELEGAMNATVAALVFEHGRCRPDTFRALCDAVFALEARRDELHVEHGVYAMHPGGASRDLQRAIGNSLFAQGWLPYLDDATGAELLARTGLALAYCTAPPPPTRAIACEHCDATVDVVAAARRVVCTCCGRITAAAAAT
ncbi:MAG: DUF1266 domain-containing protein [Deltaproteobacteria bacterium]|nr:DUF1266 domain-containing protein [Deltaproteobacteria bacterium]